MEKNRLYLSSSSLSSCLFFFSSISLSLHLVSSRVLLLLSSCLLLLSSLLSSSLLFSLLLFVFSLSPLCFCLLYLSLSVSVFVSLCLCLRVVWCVVVLCGVCGCCCWQRDLNMFAREELSLRVMEDEKRGLCQGNRASSSRPRLYTYSLTNSLRGRPCTCSPPKTRGYLSRPTPCSCQTPHRR